MTPLAIDGLIFDLDGTLVDSRLDFVAMRRETGTPEGTGLLEFIAGLPTQAARDEAMAVVHKHEIAGALNATWMPGAERVIHTLYENRLPIAIVTRNSRQAATLTMERLGIPAIPLRAREDAAPKPDPEALLAVASEWQLPPARCAYVGDFRYDIEAAERAGMRPILYTGTTDAPSEYLGRARILRDFVDLLTWLPLATASRPAQ